MTVMLKPLEFTTKAQWLSYLEQAHTSEIDLGLSRITKVFKTLNLPRPKKIITCAGTNGKGSTLRFLEILALKQNFTVGKYTSPHLIEFNERIVINDKQVSDDLLIQALQVIYQNKGDVSLSYFEYTTLVALYLFAHFKLDIWLIEVGLGGRLDASNCLDADVGIVSSIALDHADWLGTDLDVIRFEKCGIGRTDQPLILGEDVYTTNLHQRLVDYFEVIPELHVCDNEFSWTVNDQSFDLSVYCNGQVLSYKDLKQPILPVNNAACAITAWIQAGFKISQIDIEYVLSHWQLAGRLTQIKQDQITYTIDVGHNAHAAKFIAKQLPKQDICILGMMADKDVAAVTSSLKGIAQQFILVDLEDMPRAIKKEKLNEFFDDNTILVQSVAKALQKVKELQSESKVQVQEVSHKNVLICGSFITCGLALEILGEKQ
ncbi:MAG: hypothetical protein HRU38_21265 [Saccharospirillaceae bacterium]|nr:hypothetical protein [Pseudomonadales bacterium]NRB81160.1 hypothetical protein [Saccharospirillaceae bacterium]